MIYLDTSVALAHLLAEDRCPPASLWEEQLISSRLLQAVTIASYDDGLVGAARMLGFVIAEI